MHTAYAYCSSKNGAYRNPNSELFLSSQALCRLVHSRPGHLYNVQVLPAYVFICALRSLYSALNVIPLQYVTIENSTALQHLPLTLFFWAARRRRLAGRLSRRCTYEYLTHVQEPWARLRLTEWVAYFISYRWPDASNWRWPIFRRVLYCTVLWELYIQLLYLLFK